MQNKVKIGIIGAAGYTGGELIRILLNHPHADIAFAHSKSNADHAVHDVHTDLLGDTNLHFTNSTEDGIDVLFLCNAHGGSKKFLTENKVSPQTKIIDLSQDHRLNKKEPDQTWVYGLPEMNKEKIKHAQFIANPGCFATCIQLGLLPLAHKGFLKDQIHVSATTGSTGAGQSLSETSHFSWRSNNLSPYKSFEHQHLDEIKQSIKQLQNNFNAEINLIPHRGNFARGLLATLYTESDLSLKEANELYESYYASQPFVHISKKNIDLKQVINTNKCVLYIEKHGNKLMITSVIDNLLKGASGQAVQNMNLAFGLDETSGLKLKAVAF